MIWWVVLLGLVRGVAFAEVKKEMVEYRDGQTVLEGYLVYDTGWEGKRPAVMVVHQWMGLTDHEKGRAEKLAQEGYVAFAIDVYGKGVHPTQAEAGSLAGKYKGDLKLFRQREKAAFDFLKKHPKVDSKKIVITGFCFGGTGALEAARSGLPVVGAVSFHGGLSTKNPKDAKNIRSKILVLHGAIDPFVPQSEVEGFLKEMNDAKVDYQFVAYANAVHAFTQKEAGTDNFKGAAYNADADRRSWQAFSNFLSEVAPINN